MNSSIAWRYPLLHALKGLSVDCFTEMPMSSDTFLTLIGGLPLLRQQLCPLSWEQDDVAVAQYDPAIVA